METTQEEKRVTMTSREVAIEMLRDAIISAGYDPTGVEIHLDRPSNLAHGDLYSNVAFALAKKGSK